MVSQSVSQVDRQTGRPGVSVKMGELGDEVSRVELSGVTQSFVWHSKKNDDVSKVPFIVLWS